MQVSLLFSRKHPHGIILPNKIIRRKVGSDKSGVDKLNRIISCEVQILKGVDNVKGVIWFDYIGEVGIREVSASGGVDVIARA